MKAFAALAVLGLFAVAQAGEVNPIGKVMEMISDTQTKVIGEGEKAQKIYEEFSEWCEESNKNLAFEIKTAKAEIIELKATISEETALIESLTTRQEELAGRIKIDEQDLKSATFIRDAEASEFAAEKAELDDIIDTLERAIKILEKHASAALLQAKGAASLAEALKVMVEASAFSSADAQRLTALVQESQSDDEDDAGAPAASTFEGHSAGIVELLEKLLEQAQTTLGNAQNKETKNIFEFEQLKQSIEDAIAYSKKELAEAKKGIAGASEKKAAAEGDLELTSKDLAEDTKAMEELHTDCMTKAEEFEAETKSRSEELEALAKAKQILKETTSPAAGQAYGLEQVSLVQTRLEANFEIVRFVRELSKRQKAPALAQLASRMAAALEDQSISKEDIFTKVKGLIFDMITKLEKEAAADAKHKAYCDKELKYANEKKDARVTEIEKLTTSIDEMTAKSAQLKEQVATLEKELMNIAQEQAQMDKIRAEEKETFEKAKADLELGIAGVKQALKILREYYAKDKDHDAAEGAGTGIIGMLEVCESDFQKGLSEATGDEESAQAEYDKVTKENEIQTTTKEQDVKYKTKESKDLDKATAEAKSDKDNVQEELDAVNKYLEKLHEECDEAAPTYEELQKRRSAEIAGLKQALEILEGETASLLQEGSKRSLRRLVAHKVVA